MARHSDDDTTRNDDTIRNDDTTRDGDVARGADATPDAGTTREDDATRQEPVLRQDPSAREQPDPLGLGGTPPPDAPSRRPKPAIVALIGEFLSMSRTTAILLLSLIHI